MEKLAPPLMGELVTALGTGAGELSPRAWVQERWKPRLTNTATTPAYIQGFELVHCYVYLICELLEHMKGLVLQKHSCRTSMTQGGIRHLRGVQ